jgi:WD40 repeat protein
VRRITICFRAIRRHRGLVAVTGALMGSFSRAIIDVRLLGAIAAALIIVAMQSIPQPGQVRAPSQRARGKSGVRVLSVSFSTTGRRMATVTMAGQVTVRTTTSGEWPEQFFDFPDVARAVAISEDGRSLAVAGMAQGIYLWDLRLSSRSSQPATIVAVPISRSSHIMFSPDGHCLAVTSGVDGTIVLWDLTLGRERMRLRHPSRVTSLAFTPDGRWLATGGFTHTLQLWHLETGLPRDLHDDGRGPIDDLAFSSDGALLVSSTVFERSVRLWDLNTSLPCRVFAEQARSVTSVVFSPDGSLLATASNDGTVGLWSVATGQRRANLDGQATILESVAFSADGRTLFLATGDDDDLRSWNLADLF